MVSGGLGGGTEAYSSSERPIGGGNPRPYLAPPAGMNDSRKQAQSKRIASSPPSYPTRGADSDRRTKNNTGATVPKRNTQKEKKEKRAPPVFV